MQILHCLYYVASPGQGNNKLAKVSDSLERYSTDTLLACEKQVQKLIKLAFAVSAV